MAQLHLLPEETLAELTAQISRQSSPGALVSGAEMLAELTESFPVYALQTDPTLALHRPLRDAVSMTGQWHHQIRHGSEAKGFALSQPHGPATKDWKVNAVFSSDIAHQIDETLAWIDAQGTAIPEGHVNLLIAPSFLAHALWIEAQGVDLVIVANLPAELDSISTRRVYTAEEFLSLLAATPPPRGFPVWDATSEV
jgi:hypothetical protein